MYNSYQCHFSSGNVTVLYKLTNSDFDIYKGHTQNSVFPRPGVYNPNKQIKGKIWERENDGNRRTFLNIVSSTLN